MKDIIRKIIRENMVELNYVEDYLPNVDLRNKKKISNDVIPLELLNDIQTAAERAGVTVTIMFAKSNHKKNTKSGTVSRHYLSKALDISMINGRAIDEKTRSITDDFVAELEKLGYYRNAEGGNPKSVLWKMRDKSHYDHVHVSNMGGGNVTNADLGDTKKSKIKKSGLVTVSPKAIKKIIELLKSENIKDSDITPLLTKSKKIKISSEITSDDDFYESILKCIGAPKTQENMMFLYAWRQAEGGQAKNNPFNTTMKYEGSTRYGNNIAGVKNYLTPEDGIDATCKTLKLKYYTCIVDGLKNDIGAKRISQMCNSSLRTWGTHGSSPLITKILSSYESGSTPKPKKISV